MSGAVERALALLRSGDAAGAEDIVRQAVAEARVRFEPGSSGIASACCDLGNVLFAAGQLEQAIEAYREACAPPGAGDEAATRNRLTYLVNLGEALAQAGELEDAERALRESVAERVAVYGRDHAGHAFGLLPLAELVSARGRAAEALPIADQAIQILWNDQHPRVTSAIAARGRIVAALGDASPENAYAWISPPGAAILQDIVEGVLSRFQGADPALERRALGDALAFVERCAGPSDPLTMPLLMQAANAERDYGDACDHDRRVAAIRRVLAAYDAGEDAAGGLQTVLGLALAESDAGRSEAALAAYEDARRRADAIGEPALLSQVDRNFGLFLADLDRRVEAERHLRQAVAEASRGPDAEVLGRAEIALGLFLQHGGDVEPARRSLERALGLMDPAHPDALCARSHLEAIEAGSSCGCGDMGGALASAFREYVLARLPEGLVRDLKVDLREGDFALEVEMDREPTKEESETFERVVRHALEAFRRRATSQP